MKAKIVTIMSLSMAIIFSSVVMARPLPENDVLFDAMSTYEDLTEYALDNDANKVEKTIGSLDITNKKLKNSLSEKGIKCLVVNTEMMMTAMKDDDYATIALYAVDSYKTIAEVLDTGKLIIPIEVVLLDYVGFKVRALLKQNNIDWIALNGVSVESVDLWKNIEKNIADKGLRDVMNTAINGIRIAVNSKNIEMLNYAAQVDLDLVDLLEGYFENNK